MSSRVSKTEQQRSQRTFGRVLQQVSENKRSSKHQSNERPWNPSPSKRSKLPGADQGYHHDENACNAWGNNTHDYQCDKENRTNNRLRLQNKCATESTATSVELNNSFTEKISNLDIGTTRVDQVDADDLYTPEILKHWHKLEVEHRINPAYMNKQKEISFKMRTILIDWLVEVAVEYSIHNATLHRGVQFVDRFLSKLQISRNNLQLLGTTSLFIACKIEEINPPDTSDLVYITDNTYDKEQLLKMECLVLSVLDFDLLVPTAHEFTEYYAHVLKLTHTAKGFSMYAIELTLLYGETFLRFRPCVVGVAACFVAIKCCVGSVDISLDVGAVVRAVGLGVDVVGDVNEVVGLLFVTILNVSSCRSSDNSVCSKYKKFQEQRFVLAVTSAAACVATPWHNSLLL